MTVPIEADLELVACHLEAANEALENVKGEQISSATRERISRATGIIERKLRDSPWPAFDPALYKVVFGAQAQAAFRLAFRMRLFEAFNQDQTPISIDELAAKTKADRVLTGRVTRALCSVGIIAETDDDYFVQNVHSKKLANPVFGTLMNGLASMWSPYMASLPDFIEETGFKNPDDGSKTLFQYSAQTEQPFFQWLHTQPMALDVFSKTMVASTQIHAGTITAILRDLFKDAPPLQAEDTLMVDVGGGRGEILGDFRKAHPELKGRMIVQDLAGEVNGRQQEEGVESMVYDFFTPQPVQGAHTYFFRHIFHDQPDHACHKILQSTVSAMTAESRLLIMDTVLPNRGASAYSTLLDINMIAIAGIERTERQWTELLEGAGLRVTAVKAPPVGDGIIIAKLRSVQ